MDCVISELCYEVVINIGSEVMMVLYPNLCYNNVLYKVEVYSCEIVAYKIFSWHMSRYGLTNDRRETML